MVHKRKTLTYGDVLLVPQYSEIMSRKEIDIGGLLDHDIYLSLPIVSSPMDTVTEERMANAMSDAGGTGIIHRYNSIDEQCDLIAKTNGFAGGAIGITGDYLTRASALAVAGAAFLCVDVAHGHHVLVKNAIAELRRRYKRRFHIMAGNVATLEAFNDLSDWGADSIRVGIGGGSICSTRIQTGHGVPGLQSVINCAKSDRDAKLVADGGIKTSGDIVKALAAGADFVMLGSMLAGTDETPGQLLTSVDGKSYKVYRGMASREAQVAWRGEANSLEGISTTLPYKGSVVNILKEIRQNIRSGFSYSGAAKLDELHARAKFIVQTPAGQSESDTHILHRSK